MWCVYLVSYFGCGLLLDALITLHYRAISCGRVGLSCLLTFLITVISMAVFDHFIDNQSFMFILSYGLGAAVGAYIGMITKRIKPSQQ